MVAKRSTAHRPASRGERLHPPTPLIDADARRAGGPTAPYVIRDLARRTVDGWAELSADVDGFRVWIRFPGDLPIAESGDPFLVLALPEAMGLGRPIRIDASAAVSPGLVSRVEEVQGLYHSWNEELRRVAVAAATESPGPASAGGATFFSGGVDSTYTVLRRRNETEALFSMGRFDFVAPPDVRAERVRRQEAFASRLGLRLVSIETNVREYADARRVQWALIHGNCLAAVALASGFRTVRIPASHTYAELFPWGTHPLLDGLWSNGRTEIVHDGAGQRRTEKVRYLADYPDALDDVRICWRDPNRNCQTCAKCIRDRTTLYLIGARTSALSPLESVATLRGWNVRDASDRTFVRDVLLLARETGDTKIERALARKLWRYDAQEALERLDRVFLFGALRRLYRRVARPEWLSNAVTLEPKHRR